ncbi:hypothetical protein E2C01_078707 [Portunus trituberculatus]|uniref:Uncharacterized protein n=1 Tax=Portunus trituberculatus TaxID=210409 RepID=A0A5B7INJ0_PORTR|nr:hypothetical protein [Portunus trituberculatus]
MSTAKKASCSETPSQTPSPSWIPSP